MAVSTGQGEDEVMSTINITPFTDVLLVLLIIFIILASVTKEPKLPDANNTDKVQPSQIVVIHRRARTRFKSARIKSRFPMRTAAFEQLQDATDHRFKSVIIKADPKATYGTILQVMDAAKQTDLTDFGLANHVQARTVGATP